MFTRQNIVRLTVAVLLLALLAVPVLNAAVDSGMAFVDNPDSNVLFEISQEDGRTAIACNTGDPDSSGGGGC